MSAIEQARQALEAARLYVVDALDAHEHSDGREALAKVDAALSALAAGGGTAVKVKVKALEWEEREARRLSAMTEKFWRGQTAFDWGYRVVNREGCFLLEGNHLRHESLDAAKAAAQADYERRIRSALEGGNQ